MAALQDVKNIAQSRSLRRGDDADAARKLWNGFLAGRVEQPLSLQLGLELFECNLQGARAFRLQIFGGKLKIAPAFEHGNPAAKDDLHAVVGAKSQETGL